MYRYHVTVLAEKFVGQETSPSITSQVAAGIWQVPLSINQWRNEDIENTIKVKYMSYGQGPNIAFTYNFRDGPPTHFF
jgi:hypothetical protein